MTQQTSGNLPKAGTGKVTVGKKTQALVKQARSKNVYGLKAKGALG